MVQSHAVADNVQSEMARQRKTQSDIAAVLHLTRQAISRRLTGQTEFSVAELQAVADYLGVPASELLGERTPSTTTTSTSPQSVQVSA